MMFMEFFIEIVKWMDSKLGFLELNEYLFILGIYNLLGIL